MEEKDNELWTELFRDRPIPKTALETFQDQIMAQIAAHPVNYGLEIRLAARRKWGLGLALSLMISGTVLGISLWFGSDLLFQGLSYLFVSLPGFPYVSGLEQVGQRILQGALVLKDLKTGMDLLWEVVSWPLLGMLSVIVIFKNWNGLKTY